MPDAQGRLVNEVYPHEIRLCTCEVHAYEVHAREMHAHEGFCEDLARQNTVAHPSQLQLGFWRCHIWVTSRHIWVTCCHMGHVLSHMGTCCHI